MSESNFIIAIIILLIALPYLLLWSYLYRKSFKSKKIRKLGIIAILALTFVIIWLFIATPVYEAIHEGQCCSSCKRGTVCPAVCEPCPDPVDTIFAILFFGSIATSIILPLIGIYKVVKLNKKPNSFPYQQI